MSRKPRLHPSIFHLPVERMREGYYSDKYFVRTRELLLKDNHRPCVTMQVFGKAHAFLGGIDEAIAILKLCSTEWDELQVYALYDGDEIEPWETVLLIEGPYDAFAHLETLYLGVLARRTKVGTNTRRVVEAARPKQVMFFPARHDHWLVQTGDGYAAHIAGAIGASTRPRRWSTSRSFRRWVRSSRPGSTRSWCGTCAARSTGKDSGSCGSWCPADSPSRRSASSRRRTSPWTCTESGRACSRGASTSRPTWCGWRGNRSPRWAAAIAPTRGSRGSSNAPLGVQVFVVPRHIPLHPVAQVARLADPVMLPRIDHELSLDAEAAKRLVHLLRVEQGYVEVLVAAQEQSRRDDAIGVQERGR